MPMFGQGFQAQQLQKMMPKLENMFQNQGGK